MKTLIIMEVLNKNVIILFSWIKGKVKFVFPLFAEYHVMSRTAIEEFGLLSKEEGLILMVF